MAKNEFLPFGTAANANVMPNADYQTLPLRTSGFVSGVAKSEVLNTVWRQASVISHVVAQSIADNTGKDVLDNGDTQALLNAYEDSISGRLIAVRTFNASGTYTPSKMTKKIIVEVCGGGGGGAGTPATPTTSHAAAGSGGGGGAYGKAIFTSGFASVAVVIGAGGAGGNGVAGLDGGKTSFGALLSASGGKGAPNPTLDTQSFATSRGGSGGSDVSGANIEAADGQPGFPGAIFIGNGGYGGTGGSSSKGNGGGYGVDANAPSVNGSGSGGGGVISGGGNPVFRGAAGAPGVVIVYEYS